MFFSSFRVSEHLFHFGRAATISRIDDDNNSENNVILHHVESFLSNYRQQELKHGTICDYNKTNVYKVWQGLTDWELNKVRIEIARQFLYHNVENILLPK